MTLTLTDPVHDLSAGTDGCCRAVRLWGVTRYVQAYKRTATKFLIYHSSLSTPIMSSDLPLPYGWTQEFDPKTNHPFWVSNTSFPSP
jgi:hypothetical protein